AEGVPLLRLPTIFALARPFQDIGWEIVAEPIRRFGDWRDRPDRGLLVKLARSCHQRILARIDPALRHLPIVARLSLVDGIALADEDPAGSVEQHDADTRAIG